MAIIDFSRQETMVVVELLKKEIENQVIVTLLQSYLAIKYLWKRVSNELNILR